MRDSQRLSSPLLSERKTWLAITIFWTVVGLGSWLIEYGLSFKSPEGPMTLGRAAARLVYAVLWWGVSVFAAWIGDAIIVCHYRQILRIVFHVLVGAAVAVLWAVLGYYISLAIIPGWLPLGVGRMVNTTFMTSYFYYLGMVTLGHGMFFGRESRAREREAHTRELEAKAREMEAQARALDALQKARLADQAQLQALKMELQPHFLFNTLHAISALIERNPQRANDMLVLLADMLQIALENVRDAEVTLAEEIETVKLYLSIQRIRFGERLRTEYDIDAAVLTARVPHMIFQPLAENAIKHGIGDRGSGGRILISAHAVDGRLHLAVQDDGVGLREARPTEGLGLKNTRERLAFLYGDGYELSMAEAPGGGTCVAISIPFQTPDAIDAIG